VAEGDAMTKAREREIYLLKHGWGFIFNSDKCWSKDGGIVRHTFLGAFMRQQAADARAEREAEGR
jgi:hypothetical protein